MPPEEQAGRGRRWEARSAALLPELLNRAEWLEGRRGHRPGGRELPAAPRDAEAVLTHLKGGGGWGDWIGSLPLLRTGCT